MKSLCRWLPALPLVLSSLVAVAWSTPDPKADADYAALKILANQLPPWLSRSPDGQLTGNRKPTRSEWALWNDRHADTKAKAALKFMADHPADPRRWDAAVIAMSSARTFIVSIKPGYGEAADAKDEARMKTLIDYDDAAKAAWTRRTQAMADDLLAAPDAPADAVGGALHHQVLTVYSNRELSAQEKLSKYRALYAAFTQRAPQSRNYLTLSMILLRQTELEDPATYPGLLQEMKASPNADVAAQAVARLRLEAVKEEGFDLEFTALDGRKVDLSQLRGKVVLIDFWATWCGPCVAELPNVRQVYAIYHDKGFEIIGISLDKASDRQKLIGFTAKENMPWPQFFDGKYWKNELAEKYGIQSIPAMFLLDQTGKVVSTNARGEKLEAEVKRLLGL